MGIFIVITSWTMCGISLAVIPIVMLMFVLQGVMLVYDVTNEKSFDSIKHWIREIEEVSNNIIVINYVQL